MGKFEVNILGCGSALPTLRHLPSAQVLNIRENLFMIDCGEGTQLQMRRMRLKFSRLGHIFLTHLHGDHCFGLLGLISTLELLGHSGELVIHAPADAERVFRPQLDFFCRDMATQIRFEPVSTGSPAIIHEDKAFRVTSFPLRHRVPTAGYLFEEKQGERHLIGDMVKFYEIPVRQIPDIKSGADFITKDGTVIPNERLTRPATPAVRYAYCCDTMYRPDLASRIEGVDLLYHDATYGDGLDVRAKETMHSTARQAAMLARDAQVKQLLLGHFSARYDDETALLQQAREIFPNTILAKEGLNIPLGHP